MKTIAIISLLVGLACGEIYFSEKFDKGYEKRWVQPGSWKAKHELGKWLWTGGEWFGDAEDKGIQTSQDYKFYGYSAQMDKKFDNMGKDLVFQFSNKYEQDIDCGGAYIKILHDGVNQDKFGGDTPYAIMFGPDVCGEKRKVHIILNYKGKNLEGTKNFRVIVDKLTHMYTFVLHPDNTFEYKLDGVVEDHGSLYELWPFLEPRQIVDPSAVKPANWVDNAKIPDPEDKKPADWDDVPAEIPDPVATKPEDWDDVDDGEWDAPMIPNPDYRGEWEPHMIDNPEFKGEWKPSMIDNPHFVDDPMIYNICKDCNYVGFELWQVKSGSVFDDIIVTDSVEEADTFAQATFYKKREAERTMWEDSEKQKKMDQEDAAKAAAAADDEDEEQLAAEPEVAEPGEDMEEDL